MTTATSMNVWIARAKQEVRDLIPVLVFFFVTFQLLAVTEALMLEEYGIRAHAFVGATLMALVIAKAVLLADHFPLVNRFPDKPLMYNVLWKTAIYFGVSLVVRYFEHLATLRFVKSAPNLGEANRRLFAEMVWPHFWGVQIWLLVVLIVYCALRELARALGRERVLRMFFFEAPREGGGVGNDP